jgi:acylphosphatase
MRAFGQSPERRFLLGRTMECDAPAAYLGNASSNARVGMSREITVRLRISGRVQGVAYRAWAERQASLLFLSGWVRNRRDGSVEAVFSGPEEAVRDMIERCHRGPPLARVAAVTEQIEATAPDPGFRHLPTL